VHEDLKFVIVVWSRFRGNFLLKPPLLEFVGILPSPFNSSGYMMVFYIKQTIRRCVKRMLRVSTQCDGVFLPDLIVKTNRFIVRRC
jgi:hypothetical protein